MSKSELVAKRNQVIKQMNSCSKSWEPNKIRRLQVEASRLANEIGRAS